MSVEPCHAEQLPAEAVADYCAGVEEAVRRRTRGPLARITGADFAAVLEWAQAGIPLSVVGRAIDDTVERLRTRGRPARIRVALLDADVRRVEAERRRAVGPGSGASGARTGRIRNCPAPPVGCGAPDRGADDRCVHCGWDERNAVTSRRRACGSGTGRDR